MKQKNLNTSVKITDRLNHTEVYPTIEEASEKCGLSVQAIKIRANKNSIPKDGIRCEWVDPHTKKSFKASQSKRKGNAYELKIIHELTDLGYEGLVSSRSESKRLDDAKIDIADTLGVLDFYAQCKRTKNTPNIETITEACLYKDKPLIIFWSKESDKQQNNEYILMPKNYFYKLLKNK